MSIQSKIENATFNTKKKVFDNAIRTHGIEVKGIRLYIEQNKYKDITELEITSDNEITAYIDILNTEIPLNRYRLDSTDSTIDSETIYLFEIIPIDLYAKMSDNLEKDDIIVLLLKDKIADIDIPIVFRISDVIGRFQSNLLWKKYSIAPLNPGNIETVVRDKILEYINAG